MDRLIYFLEILAVVLTEGNYNEADVVEERLGNLFRSIDHQVHSGIMRVALHTPLSRTISSIIASLPKC